MFVDRSLWSRHADPSSGTETLGIPAFSKLDLQWLHAWLLFVFFCSIAQSHDPSCFLTFLKPSPGSARVIPRLVVTSCQSLSTSPRPAQESSAVEQMLSLFSQHHGCALLSSFLPLGWFSSHVCSPLPSHSKSPGVSYPSSP